MTQPRGALTLCLSCLLYLINAQQHELVSSSIDGNFFDHVSAALIDEVDVMVLRPTGEDIKVISSDSSDWIRIEFNDQQTIKILATAHGYESDTFNLDLNSPRYTLPLSGANPGQILDRQPIQRADQRTQRRAPAVQDPMELIVMSEKRGGRMSRLQRVPTNFTGYTILLRNDRNTLKRRASLIAWSNLSVLFGSEIKSHWLILIRVIRGKERWPKPVRFHSYLKQVIPL